MDAETLLENGISGRHLVADGLVSVPDKFGDFYFRSGEVVFFHGGTGIKFSSVGIMKGAAKVVQ